MAVQTKVVHYPQVLVSSGDEGNKAAKHLSDAIAIENGDGWRFKSIETLVVTKRDPHVGTLHNQRVRVLVFERDI